MLRIFENLEFFRVTIAIENCVVRGVAANYLFLSWVFRVYVLFVFGLFIFYDPLALEIGRNPCVVSNLLL